MIIDLFSGWWILAIIFGVLYGAAAIAGLFLVLVVGDVQAREDETLPGVWLAEFDAMCGFVFEKYVAAAMRDLSTRPRCRDRPQTVPKL